ncbi:sulfurtransferase TusA family protein [Geobacillus kaustophilus]|uniref:Sulfurtransferase TusA family protein n=1 Tax=Geobacillus kaustophilus TaxID=1462 RepID=A0A0D8BTY8_GEOKU|nr:sulfurtransferase TusA family protein [Geobacillus kaustophilus]KJE27600.1 sulfurtransferase TusA family protein [Geobacillus kaustophilus]
MNVAKVLDAKGLACPMPVVRAKKAMDELESGQVLEVQTTDKGAKNDLPAWAKTSGHTVIEMKEENGVLTFWIQKG